MFVRSRTAYINDSPHGMTRIMLTERNMAYCGVAVTRSVTKRKPEAKRVLLCAYLRKSKVYFTDFADIATIRGNVASEPISLQCFTDDLSIIACCSSRNESIILFHGTN